MNAPPPRGSGLAATSSPISRTFSALRVRNYRLYFFGQFVSFSGTWMQRVAQTWLVLRLTSSPLALGTLTAIQFLPVLLFSLFGGVIADRLPKRKLLVTSQAVMSVQAIVMALLTSTDRIELWHVYVLAAVLGCASALDNPTRQAFVMEMVGPSDLPNAVALNSSLNNAARVLGPAAGGLLTWGVGEALCFWLNALSYLAVIGALLAMRASELHNVPTPIRGRIVRQLGEGVSYATKTREICVILIPLAFLGMFGFNFLTVVPLLARFVLGGDAKDYGLLFSCLGAGSVVAALYLASYNRATNRMIFVGGAAFSLLLLLTALSTWYVVTGLLLFALGGSSILFQATTNTRMQLVPPPELRGRVMSIYTMMVAGSKPLGSFMVGTLSEKYDVPIALSICAGLCLVGLLAGLLYARGRPAGAVQPAEARL
ncbi:MAG: MFS transporter [Chloroflexi bacterium]|nr:MFS transporter [Chloroflexota bacterium]